MGQDLRKLGLTVCNTAQCGVEVAQGAGAGASCWGGGAHRAGRHRAGHARVWCAGLGCAEQGVHAKKGHVGMVGAQLGYKRCNVVDTLGSCTGATW